MSNFLYLLMIAFLGAMLFFVVLIFGGYFVVRFWLRRKFGSIMEQLQQMGGALGAPTVPPFRMTLAPDDDLNWMDEAALERDTEALVAAGFERDGDYLGEESPVSVRTFLHKDHGILAAIQSLYGMKQWTDLVTLYADGSACTFCNLADHGMARPPWRTAKFLPDVTVDELLEQHLAERPAGKPIRTVARDDLARIYSECYAREMDWRIERGGVTEEEIHATLATSGQTAEPDTVRVIQDGWKLGISNFLDEQAQEQLLKEDRLSAREWEESRDRVLVIHDRTPASVLYEGLGGEDEEEDDGNDAATELIDSSYDGDADDSPRLRMLVRRLKTENPRDVFAELNKQRPAAARAKLLSSLPVLMVTADVYVEAEDGEEE